MNTYELITNKIIEKMKTGQVPWRKPWKFQPPRNLVSKRRYHGINFLLLTDNEYESPYYVTFHQAKQLGGSIKKGEHGTPIVFWKLIETLEKSEENEEEKPKVIPYLQYSTVFNLSQTEGIDAPAAFLEAFKNDGLAADIDAAGGEGKGFRDPATRVIQHGAQRPYGPVGLCGGVKEGVTLGGCEVRRRPSVS